MRYLSAAGSKYIGQTALATLRVIGWARAAQPSGLRFSLRNNGYTYLAGPKNVAFVRTISLQLVLDSPGRGDAAVFYSRRWFVARLIAPLPRVRSSGTVTGCPMCLAKMSMTKVGSRITRTCRLATT